MIRVIVYFFAIVTAAFALSILADQPGSLVINWMGREFRTSVFVAIIVMAAAIATLFLLWSALRSILSSPGTVLARFRKRREEKGIDALSRGIIAVGVGDVKLAHKYSKQAQKALANQPLSALLRAQAAQLRGDKLTVQRIYEAMLESPETELLGLRGLYVEARRENQEEPARQYAERALKLNARLAWASKGLLELQCRDGQWERALETLALAKKNGQVVRALAKRQRAVLLTARAMELKETQSDKALKMASEAHGLAPDLVPAAEIAGLLLANRGNTSKSTQILKKTWRLAPHPDIATAYAYARMGDSPRDRFKRVLNLAQFKPDHIESAIAIANTAIEASDWKEARGALKPLLKSAPPARVCTLMARIEGGEYGDKGRVREWLARALRAPRDPVWTADGYVSDNWAPVSPITGELDAFEWKVPADFARNQAPDMALDEFVSLPATEPDVVEKPAEPAKIIRAEDSDQVSANAEAKDIEIADIKSDGVEAVPAEILSEEPKALDDSTEKNVGPADEKPKKTKVFNPPPTPDDPGPHIENMDKSSSEMDSRYRMSR